MIAVSTQQLLSKILDARQQVDSKFLNIHFHNLPKSVDLRPEMPPVEHQKDISTCTANAFAGLLEYFVRRKYNLQIYLSRLFIYFNARRMNQNQSVTLDRGSTLTSTAKALYYYGICNEQLWPYKEEFVNATPRPEAFEQASHVTIISTQIPIKLRSLKESLANDMPVVISIFLHSSASAEAQKNNGYIRVPNCKSLTPNNLVVHAIVLCGYDDTTKHFIARNSWGKLWGIEGYFYIPYTYLTTPQLVNRDDCAWAIKDIKIRSQTLPIIFPSHVAKSHKKDTEKQANAYSNYQRQKTYSDLSWQQSQSISFPMYSYPS